jgi:GntR family transcriptional regulator
MRLNPTSPIPLYQQLKWLIERKIAAGEWTPERPIPPELALAEEYGVSRITVRQALDELVKEGRIYRQRGRGTFVSPPKIAQTLAHLTGLAEELALRGMAPRVTVLTHGVVSAGHRVAEALHLQPEAQVLYIRRLVEVGERPLFVDDSYFPWELAAVLTRERVAAAPIYTLLESAGRLPSEGEQWLEAVALSGEVARLLGVEPGTPGLAITRVTKDQMGAPIEWTEAIYRGDRYQYAISLKRSQIRPVNIE